MGQLWKRCSDPLTFLVAFLTVQAALLFLSSALLGKGIEIVFKLDMPLDFIDFFEASSRWREGINPYESVRFVTPPFSAVVMAPFVGFNPRTVSLFFFAAEFFSLVVGFQLLAKKYLPRPFSFGSLFLILGLSYPCLFILQRGNLDALVFLLVALHLCAPKEWMRSVALAVAILFKVYPALLLVGLVLQRRHREWLGCLLALALFSLPFGALNLEFIGVLQRRAGGYAPIENLSLVSFYHGMFDLLSAPFGVHGARSAVWPALGWITFGTLFSLLLRRIPQTSPWFSLALLPFLMLIPAQVFPYVGLFGLASIFYFEGLADCRHKRLGAVGLAMICLHGTAWQLLTGMECWHLVNSAGAFLIAYSVVGQPPPAAVPR